MPRTPGRMANLGNEVFKQTDLELADDELELLSRTSIDWEVLRPKVANPALIDKLCEAVNEATQRNESIAQLKGRLQQLGEEGLKLSKEVIRLLSQHT